MSAEKAPVVRRLERRNWWILAVLLAGSGLLCSERFTAGVAIGGIISIAGFYTLQRVVRNVLRLPPYKAPARIVAYHYARMGLLGVILGWIISQRAVDPLALVLGLSVVVLNLLLATLMDLRKIQMEV